MGGPLRVGVIGCGLVAQAVHLPNLAALRDRFEIAALADPSSRVGEALARRYAPARSYLDWHDLLAREDLDACVVCSPHATHAEIVLAALQRGLHVFVEKPLCISVEDGNAIATRTLEADRVVQVGYMKRYSRGYQALLDGLPAVTGLRLVDVVTYDPWMAREPFVPWRQMVAPDDIPAGVRAAAAADEARQVADTVGHGDAATVRAFSYTFLACLVHDVNLVHGVLEALGVDELPEAVHSAAWADGDAATATLRLPGGSRWHCSWLLLRGIMDYRECVSLYFDDGVHELTFPVPYHASAPAVHTVVDAADGSHRRRRENLADDAYIAELEHFHDCVTRGVACRTPPRQAVKDLVVLRELFLRRDIDAA
jgi:predicted dehydrogenase